jgi:hypothetical protein
VNCKTHGAKPIKDACPECLAEVTAERDQWARRWKKQARENTRLRSQLRFYGGHLPSCSRSPCECGFKAAWDSTTETVTGAP